MTERTYDLAVVQTVELLTRYRFDMKGCTATELVTQWLNNYPAIWVRLAVIEALYQGRYKAISAEQILNFWCRQGTPTFHFTHDFESLICRNLPGYTATFSQSSPDNLERDYGLVSVNQKVAEASTQPTRLPLKREITRSPTVSEKQAVPSGISVSQGQSESSINPDAPVSHFHSEADEKTKAAKQPQFPANESRRAAYQRPIHQFTPSRDVSEFYFKLKAVVEQSLEENSELSTTTVSDDAATRGTRSILQTSDF